MAKKLFGLCMALAMFAIVPSLASANPVITHPTGTVVAPAKVIKLTNVGNTTFVATSGTLTCTRATLAGTLQKNNTSEGVEDQIELATLGGTGATAPGEPASECTGTNVFGSGASVTPNPEKNGLPWCLAATGATDAGTVKGGPCGTPRAIRFSLVITGIGTCTYQRAAASPVEATIDTDVSGQDALITVSEQGFPLFSKEPEGALCPSEGKLNTTLTLETDSSFSEPVYLSA